MQQLEIRRLSAAEADVERSRITEFDNPSDRSFPFPSLIRAQNLRHRLGISKATLHQYRQVALAHCEEYIEESLKNNPEYLAGYSNIPDKPPFTKKQAEILRDISLLYNRYKNSRMVVAFLEQFNTNQS